MAVGALDITLYRDDLSLGGEAPVLRGTDIPFPVVHVTAHQFRHSYATRPINHDVPQEVVGCGPYNTSHTMTAVYARLADTTIPPAVGKAAAPNN